MRNQETNKITETIIGINRQDYREVRLRHLILNKCKNVDAYASSNSEIINSFVKQIQGIDPSYTEEEIKEAIDKIYQNEYREMFYDDFLKCLSYKNATVDDYETASYRMFEEMANIYAYYSIASKEKIIKDRDNAITDLAYDAYASTIIAAGKVIEIPLKRVYYDNPYISSNNIEDKIYNTLSNYIDDENLLEKLVAKMLKTIKITYEGGLRTHYENLEYESYGTNQYKGNLLSEVIVKYVFDTNTVKEIEQILAKYNITFDEAMKNIEWYGYNDDWKGDEDWSYDRYSIVQMQDIPLNFDFDYKYLIEHNKNNTIGKTEDITLLQL